MTPAATGPRVSPAVEVREAFRIFSTAEGEAAALQGLTLTVPQGEILVILGPSGSGKTTLLRVLAGLDRASSGTVRVLGIDVGKLSERQRARFRSINLGIVEQHYFRSLPPYLRAIETVALQLELAGASPAVARLRASELLERVGLAPRARSRPGELSGGEQQRVAVCAALAHRPRLLLADEPTGELDAANAAHLYDLIGELAREEGCTAVIVTHDEQAARVANRVVRIRDGRLSGEAVAPLPGAEEAIVVGRGGWLQLPEELLARVGIGDRALATVEAERRIVLRPLEEGREQTSHAVAEQPPVLPKPTPARDEPVAVLSDVRKVYGTGARTAVVFEGMSASLDAGKLHAVTGRSGSGKTTLLHLLAGLERPSAGDVTVLGASLSGLGRAELADLRRRHVGFVGQGPNLVSFLSALENVELALAVRGSPPREARERAEGWLTEVGLAGRLQQRVDRLSAGEQQRVAIARALAATPALLLADEPTARLDEANARAIALLLARAARETGTCVVCATHDRLVIAHADDELKLDVRPSRDAAIAQAVDSRIR